MKVIANAAAILLLASVGAARGAEHVHRAHEHGSGILNVAVEAGNLEIELIAPGSDIVGFEHPPASDADRKAVEEAAALLGDGANLFLLPEAAGCALADASVESGLLEEHEAGDDEEHAEFHARYRFDCSGPESLDGIDVRYFEIFPAARELDASVLTETGQTATELTPGAARLGL